MLNYFYNVNIIVELLILTSFFYPFFVTKTRCIIFRSTCFFSCVSGICFIYFNGIAEKFLNNWLCINNYSYTIWCLLFLLELYEDDEKITQIPISIFIFLIGLFFYTSCTLIIFSLWNYIMINEKSLLVNLWIIHDLFNVLMYISFTIGFILDLKKIKFQNAHK